MKNDEELEKRILELEIEWGSLSQEQRKLLAYRKIIDLRLQEIDEKDKTQERKEEYKKEFMAIAEASDLSGLDGTFPRITVPKVIQNREQYQEALVSLWKVLENYKNLAGELKIDKALELSHLFYYMLWNGYFAVGKEHSYNTKGRLLMPGLFSFDVIRGGGVCLAYSNLLSDFLQINGKKATFVTCKVPIGKGEVESNYEPQVKRNVKNDTSFGMMVLMKILNGLVEKFGNHAITLVLEDEKFFGYDATNGFILNINDDGEASIINGKGKFQLKLCGALGFVYDADKDRLLEKLLFEEQKEAFRRKEVIFSFEEIIELVENNVLFVR